MKKRTFTVLALALVLAMALSTTAFATPTTVAAADRTAGITFTPLGNNNDGVFDPADPPGDVGAHLLQSMAISFGTHEVSPFTQVYNSITGVAGGAAGAGMSDGRSGILIISSQANWNVNVSINPFRTGDIQTGPVVMNGFSLELLPNNIGRPGDAPFTPTPGTSLTLPATSTISVGSGAANVASSAQPGVFGTNFEGNLTVIGGTSPSNDTARAIMDWALIVAP